MGIILASSSPRRKKILQKLGYSFEIEVPNVDENNINDLNPIDYVIDASMRKGLKVHQSFPTDYILSGDTIIEFENQKMLEIRKLVGWWLIDGLVRTWMD